MKEPTEIPSGTLQERASLTREEQLLRAIEAALMCLNEGNRSRAGQLLYEALPKDRKPVR